MIRTGLNTVPGTPIIPFSSVTKQGRDEIWEIIEFTMKGGYEEEQSDQDESNQDQSNQEQSNQDE